MFLPTNPRPYLGHLHSTRRALNAQASRIRVTAVDENMPSATLRRTTTRFVGMRQVLVGSRASRCVVPRWAHLEEEAGRCAEPSRSSAWCSSLGCCRSEAPMPRHRSNSHPVTRASGIPTSRSTGTAGTTSSTTPWSCGSIRHGRPRRVATITATATQNLSRFNSTSTD